LVQISGLHRDLDGCGGPDKVVDMEGMMDGMILQIADLEEVNSFVAKVSAEIIKAESKFPQWPFDLIHGAAIIGEEAGEILQAALQHNYNKKRDTKHIEEETIQCAAMCLRYWVHLRRRLP
jgi:NTP pyrophosphatase (non-canonical NTP hydrolase)